MNKNTQKAKRMSWALLLTLSLTAGLAQADTQIRSNSYEYTAQGLLSKEIVEPDRPNDCLQSTYSYDSFGNKTSVSTSACAGATGSTLLSAATARTSTNNYGADGRFVVGSTNALNQSETKAYDNRFGGLTSLIGPNSLTTSWNYDSFGRKTRESRADGTYTIWSYKLCTESGANCPSSVGPATVAWVMIEQSHAQNAAISAPEKRRYHDILNRAVRTQTLGFDGAGNTAAAVVQDTEYNAKGQVDRQSRPYALNTETPMWTNFEYDALGRVTSESHPDAGGIAITAFNYNALITTRTRTVSVLGTDIQNGQWSTPTITATQGPSPWIGNHPATVSWTSTNASVVTYKCTSTGAGFTANQTSAALSGTSASVTASDAWAANPSTCVFTAAGPGGTATYNLTVTTVPEPVFNFTQTISANTLNYNLRTAAVAAGWDQVKPLKATVTINNAVVVSSNSTSAAAFDTGVSFPNESTLILNNSGGYIIGMGGAGGGYDSNGTAGGAALRVQYAISVSNTGTIGGGGGGGGGGGSGNEAGSWGAFGGGGGGGRAGNTNSAGGASPSDGFNGRPGGAGTFSSAGGGGSAIGDDYEWAGAGGGGGGWGAAGGSGSEGEEGPGASGGAGGAAVVGNANVTWVVTGTRLGALQ
jgi:YD repeat-containing protein